MEDRGMRVSREKTEYLCLGSQEDQVHMEGSQLKRVEDFKYLGSTVQMDVGTEKEVAKRIQAGWGAWRKVTGIMCDRKVPEAVKGRMYKTMIRPAMLYGMETVAVTKGQERKMEVAEMKMLRFSLGKTRLDRIENAVIRGRVKVGELVGKIRESRLRWFGHVERQEDSCVWRRVQTLQTGRRRRGRPKRNWKDCISKDLRAAGVQPEDAQDRAKWRGAM